LCALDHGFLSSSDPNPGIVVLLVGLVLSIRISNLSLKVTLVLLVEQPQTVPVSPLCVCVDVHFDDSVLNGRRDLLLGGAGASVHDEESRFVVVALDLFVDVGLVTGKELRAENNIAGFVHAVDVAKGSGDGEHGADDRQGFVNFVNLK